MANGSRKGFYEVLTDAVNYFVEHGFTSSERLDFWLKEIRLAAERSMVSTEIMEEQLRATFRTIYHRLVEKGGLAKYHPGVERFTIQRVSPKLRAELDRRIMASANLIKLNRQSAIEKTLQRFSGWASSIPVGGSETTAKRETKEDIRKALASLPFEERRVSIDQGHKFVSSLNNILATDGGAIAAVWNDRGTYDAHYDARPEHKAWSDRKATFLVRGSWAHKRGLVKPSNDGYTDEIEAPGELVFCSCFYRYLYTLRDLPDGMLTAKGKEELARIRGR